MAAITSRRPSPLQRRILIVLAALDAKRPGPVATRDINGHEHDLTLKYLLNLFCVYVLMEPFYQFFQVTEYFKAIPVLEDKSGQSIIFYNEIPVMWIYSLSAVLTSVVYLIYAKWFVRKRVQR